MLGETVQGSSALVQPLFHRYVKAAAGVTLQLADSVDGIPDVIGVGDALGVHTGIAQEGATVTVAEVAGPGQLPYVGTTLE